MPDFDEAISAGYATDGPAMLMWLLAELFEELPEAGDLDKPKLVFFFDEAHRLFNDATDAFLDSVAQTVRLIRSKGVGVFFVTQNPQDPVPKAPKEEQGLGGVGDFLRSRQGQKLQKDVVRGVFGMLRKRL